MGIPEISYSTVKKLLRKNFTSQKIFTLEQFFAAYLTAVLLLISPGRFNLTQLINGELEWELLANGLAS